MNAFSITEPAVERQPIMINAYREARKVPLWEQAAVTLWFISTYVEIPMGSPIRYLLMAGFMAYFGLYYREIIPTMLRCWPLFLLPIFGAFSFIWADYSGAAMRSGILYLLTPFIIVILATRVPLRILLRCLFFTAGVAAVLSAPHYDRFIYGGLYASKNYFGLHMTLGTLFSLLILFNPKEHKLLRMAAVPTMLICMFFTWKSEAMTSIIFTVVGVAGLVMVRFFWLEVTRLRHMKSLILLISAAIALSAVAIVLSMPEQNLLDDFLGLVGKDSTFTGRTALWDEGRLIAEENPIFGVGLESFWQYDVGAAQTLNENDSKPYGSKLTFHNSFLEVQVHLGIIGLVLFSFLVIWVVYRTIKVWLLDPSLENSAMLLICAIMVIGTLTESWLWSTFSPIPTLFYFGAICSLGTANRKFLGQIPATLSRQPAQSRYAPSASA